MISSDPVVSSPDPAESSSFLSSPDKMPLITEEELKSGEEQQRGEEAAAETTLKVEEEEEKAPPDSKTTGSKADQATEGEADGVEHGSGKGDKEDHQPPLQLSVPDLINKDPPQQEPRAKPCDVWLRASDSRLASTPCSGKTPCRISLGEEVLGENGTPCSRGSGVGPEETEPHPDLLSFE